jgi:lipoate-protein ligase A
LNNSHCKARAAPAEPATWEPKRLPYNSSEILFPTLDVYHDDDAHSAAMNMAIDEALLEGLTVPALRFYRWESPALSFGYFGRFADIASYQSERDLARRWTGGGIVFHGEDLTYAILIPANDAAFAESSMSIYEKIHRALCDALLASGLNPVVAGVGDPGSCRATKARRGGISDAGYSCFANPVRADIMIDGHKVAGAAQRRTRRGLLQQGSIQGIDIGNGLVEGFAKALSANCCERKVDEEILKLARKLAQQKYGAESWLRKR